MMLKRGQIVGYDTDRMTFKFTMMHEARQSRSHCVEFGLG
jgi:hypothetical protein